MKPHPYSSLSIVWSMGSFRYPNPFFFPKARVSFDFNPFAGNPAPFAIIVPGIPNPLVDRRYPDFTGFPVTGRPMGRAIIRFRISMFWHREVLSQWAGYWRGYYTGFNSKRRSLHYYQIVEFKPWLWLCYCCLWKKFEESRSFLCWLIFDSLAC